MLPCDIAHDARLRPWHALVPGTALDPNRSVQYARLQHPASTAHKLRYSHVLDDQYVQVVPLKLGQKLP